MRRGGSEGNRKNGTKGSRVIRTFSQTFTTSTKTAIPGLIMCYATIQWVIPCQVNTKSMTSSDFDKTW